MEYHWTTEKIYTTTMQRVAPLPSQRAYARSLATIFSMHIHRNQLIDDGVSPDELPAPSAVVVAPTGQGKTFLVRKMAECIGLNTIVIDCGTLTAEGWKGISLSQRLAAAAKEAKNEETFSKSILFLDEVDKLHFWGTHNDQGNAMTSLLQLYNNGSVSVEIDRETKNIDVSRFTILLGGAFAGLEDIIRDRVGSKKQIGFGVDTGEKLSDAQLMQCVTHADLTEFGLMPELLGRIGTILTIPPLELEDYRQLLNAEAGSLHRKYHNYLSKLYGVTFEIADSGVEAIAQKCLDAGTGARAINPLVNDMMRSAVAAVESEFTICKVILDADEDGCCVRYEHGHRDYSFYDSARPKYHWETVREADVAGLVKKLYQYHRRSGANLLSRPQVKTFLDCALTYLFSSCRPSERTLESLEKFARVTHRFHPKSPFDIIMGDALEAGHVTQEQVRKFDNAYSPQMQQNLVEGLQIIMAAIQEERGPCRVKFDVLKLPQPPK